MTRKIISAILIFAMLAVPAAALLDNAYINADVSFSGTTAYVDLSVDGSSPDDEISATVKLYNGNVCVGTWSDSDEGSLWISGSCRAKSGASYTLKSTVYVNGVRQSVSDVTRTCP